MRILVVGGAGYVGSACLRWLLARGHDPLGFDSLVEGNAAAVPEGRLVVGDIEDRDSLASVLRGHASEAVMHFAAAASVPESIREPELYYRTNVLGTKNVLDAMHACGVGRILFSSTAATYGLHTEMPLRETSAQIPVTPYGRSKLASEWLIQDYRRAYGFGVVILRYFNACGSDSSGEYGEDRRHESHLIPLILHTAIGRRPCVQVFGNDWPTPDGTCIRDYVHTDDLANAHQLAIEALQPGESHVYNVATGRGFSVLEVLRACEAVVGRPIPHEFAARRPGDPAVLVASSDKLAHELDWRPRFTEIQHIVETAWRWHSRYPEGYASKEGGATTVPSKAEV